VCQDLKNGGWCDTKVAAKLFEESYMKNQSIVDGMKMNSFTWILLKVPEPAAQILAHLKKDSKMRDIQDELKVKVSFIDLEKIGVEGVRDSLTTAKK